MKIGSGKVFVLLFLVILLASSLRLYRFGEVPPGFTNDEANIGYDAYSILKTGKDQWGVFMPLASFRGFGDNRPPLYTYLATGSEFFFGLNEFAVRFPSVLLGISTVILTYFLAKQLFKSETIGITAAVFLAGLMIRSNIFSTSFLLAMILQSFKILRKLLNLKGVTDGLRSQELTISTLFPVYPQEKNFARKKER